MHFQERLKSFVLRKGRLTAHQKESHRTGRFKCSLVGYYKGRIIKSSGTLEGSIAKDFKGNNGFGYDPLFYLPNRGMTAAELDSKEKHKISHRGKALKKFNHFFTTYVQTN